MPSSPILFSRSKIQLQLKIYGAFGNIAGMFDALIAGFNGFGQLNGFASDDVDSGRTWMKKTNVRSIAASWSHVILATGESKDVELWGFMGDSVKQKQVLQNMPFTEEFSQMACTREKLFIVTSSGDLWQLAYKTMVWRNLRHGIVGHDEDSPKVRKVAAGDTMTVALTNSGRAYRLPGEALTLPKDCGPVVDVVCGKEHCLLLTRGKRLFSFGSSLRGQLGYGGLDSSSDPVEVDALAGMNVTNIAAGGFHNAVVTESGDLYTWGWNKEGQLGHLILDDDSPEGVLVQPEPRVVDFKTRHDVVVKNVACGASHTVAASVDDAVWGCGWNKWNQLGQSEPRRSDCMIQLPVEIPRHALNLQIVCSSWNSVILWASP